MYKLELYLIRHGKTICNENRLYCGTSNPSLSDGGKEELLKLKKDIKYPICNKYFTSGAKRSNETFEILYPNIKYEILTGFSEYNFGDFEMKSYEVLKEKKEYINWITDEIGEVSCPNGESKREYRDRVKNEFIDFIKRCEIENIESSVIVSHGGTIGTILELFYNKNKNFYEWQPKCGNGYKLIITIDEKINIDKVEEVK